MTEELEEATKDGSIESDMAQKMSDDIDATIARVANIARTAGIKDPDLRDIILSALMCNAIKAENTFGCIGAAAGFLAAQRRDCQKQIGGEPT